MKRNKANGKDLSRFIIMHAHAHTRNHARMHAHTGKYTHRQICKLAHTHTYIHTHAHTHAHTHIRTHSNWKKTKHVGEFSSFGTLNGIQYISSWSKEIAL